MSAEKCTWCGEGGVLVNGYHASCIDTKLGMNKPRISQKENKKVTSFGMKMSKTYRAQVVDFKERMARRGINIKV
jgi:hypothetical protein